jgi:hypothetical protein
VRGAVVGENLTPIGEYSSTVKNRQKCAAVYLRVVVEGLTKHKDRYGNGNGQILGFKLGDRQGHEHEHQFKHKTNMNTYT